MGNTIARTKIHKIIRESVHPITYSEIKKQMDGSCSRVTIYRILLRMEKDKLILRFPDANGDFRYFSCKDKGTPRSEHSHFHCLQCDKVLSLDSKNLKTFVPTAFLTQSISFLASGICPNCCSTK
ncbi:transcriptional repressor [Echinicola sp. CAU 1574]|uniref:Transcriptional repressor n=1 Tax=Echinicola arenosa TaxID=2774144 RepID=A0ABR9AIT6_9BACT|nr:transcriptional repressor [Echinicola arenosa]